jgi:hypothetical protein
VDTGTALSHRRRLPFAGNLYVLIVAVFILTVAGVPAIAGARGTTGYTLVFTRQPANAVVNGSISSDPYAPSGDPVRVTVYDQYHDVVTGFFGTISLSLASNPGNGTLSGILEQPVDDGSADFPNISINQSGFGYRLHAVACSGCGSFLRGSIPVAPADSGTFDIVDVAKECGAGPCSSGEGYVTDGSTKARIETSDGASGDMLFFSVSPGPLNCARYKETSSLVTFDVTGSRTKTVTVVVPRTSVRGLASYQVCYNSSNRFRNRAGRLANTGLLPDCAAVASAPPCVVSKGFEGNTVVIVFSAPLGDPKGRV